MLPADCALQACRRLTTANQHPTDYNTHSNEYITRPVQAWGQPPNGLASLGAVRKLPWQLGVSCLERHEAQSVDELHVIGLQENAHFTKPERRSRSGRPTVVANSPPPSVVMARGRPGPAQVLPCSKRSSKTAAATCTTIRSRICRTRSCEPQLASKCFRRDRKI